MVRTTLCTFLGVAVFVATAQPLKAQDSLVYRGSVTNHSYGSPADTGITGSLNIRTVRTDLSEGSLTIGAPLGGSGIFTGQMWADTVLLMSESAAGDTILWLGLAGRDEIVGSYIIVGGGFRGQGGTWWVVHHTGERITRPAIIRRPFADSFDLAGLVAPFAQFGNRDEQRRPDTKSPARTVFKGRPELKIEEVGVDRLVEDVPRREAPNLECVISQIGGRYYWASRENKELLRVESGSFITFIAVGGAGYVRLTKPDMKAMAGLMGLAEERFDYVEHMLIGLSSVTYYGRAMN